MRLDKYLAQQHPDLTRSELQQHIKAGAVTVNGVVVVKPAFDVSVDTDIIEFTLSTQPDFANEIQDFAAKHVIYQVRPSN